MLIFDYANPVCKFDRKNTARNEFEEETATDHVQREGIKNNLCEVRCCLVM